MKFALLSVIIRDGPADERRKKMKNFKGNLIYAFFAALRVFLPPKRFIFWRYFCVPSSTASGVSERRRKEGKFGGISTPPPPLSVRRI